MMTAGRVQHSAEHGNVSRYWRIPFTTVETQFAIQRRFVYDNLTQSGGTEMCASVFTHCAAQHIITVLWFVSC